MRASTPAAAVLAAVLLAVWAASLNPTPAYGGHAGAGNCPHDHSDTDPSFSSCNPGVDGKKKCLIDGLPGKCKQQLVDEPFTDVRGPSCLCVKDGDGQQALQITRMDNAVATALKAPQVLSTLAASLGTSGQVVACTQYNTAVREFLFAKGGLIGLGPITWYDARLLSTLDRTILNLSILASQASSLVSACGIVGVTLVPFSVTESLGQLAQKKLEMSQSFGRLIDQ
jgi:hypothetical protein